MGKKKRTRERVLNEPFAIREPTYDGGVKNRKRLTVVKRGLRFLLFLKGGSGVSRGDGGTRSLMSRWPE